MTGDFELNIEILRGFCLVRGQAIDFDCRLLCFQLALATRSNTEPGSKTGVCTPVESISYASDTDCWAVSAAAAGLLRLLRWLLDMLRLRSAADRPVRQLPAGRFQTGRLPAERSQAGCFQIERLRLPGRLQAGQLQHAVRQCPPAENRRHSWYSERTERFRLTCLRQPPHRIQQPPPTPLPARLCWERA